MMRMALIICLMALQDCAAWVQTSTLSSSSSRWRSNSGPRRIRSTCLNCKKQEDQLAEMVKLIMTAVDEGREGDLEKAGLKVSKRSDLELLRSNLGNPDILEKVLGTMTNEDEREVMRLLENAASSAQIGSASIDASLLAEMQAEVALLQESMRGGLDKILSGGEASAAVSVASDAEALGVASVLGGELSGGGGEAGPAAIAASSFVEEDEETEEEVTENVTSSNSSSSRTITAVDKAAAMASIESEQALSDESRAAAQATFTQLLKATMDSSEARASDAEDETMKQTIEAVTSGDFESLDIKSLLGDTLGTLAEELGIDVKSELGSSKAKGEMQAIISSSMSELAANMQELDEQSQALYEKLGNLESELRMEQEAFEMQKSAELEDLLGRQAVLQSNITASRNMVQASTEQLERLMSELDEKADVLTALALFPIKPADKKAAFVFGLALLFKVPYDSIKLFAIRSFDPSGWFGVGVQALLCLALWNHYGMLKAFFQPKTVLATLPPPPSEL